MSDLSEPLSDIQLGAIRRRRTRITEPPWEYEQPFATWQVYSQARRRRRETVAGAAHSGLWDIIASNILSAHDAAFIVEAPSDYDAMLAEIERLRAHVAQLQLQLEEANHQK